MIPKLLLFLLVQLTLFEQAASYDPCKLKYKLAVVQTPDDPGSGAEIQTKLQITRSSPYGTIVDKSMGNDDYIYPWDNSGSCSNDAADIHVFWNDQVSFSDCISGFNVYSVGLELDTRWNDPANPDDVIWDFRKIDNTFKCDGKEKVFLHCQEGGAGKLTITCTNEYAAETLFPAYIQELQSAINNENNNNLYQSYNELIAKLRQAGYYNELDQCERENNWIKHYSCRVNFFKPILGAIATFVPQSNSQHQTALNSWTGQALIGHQNWKDLKVDDSMAALMKKALVKKRPVDASLLKREMFYTQLEKLNEDSFPWKDSPLSLYAKDWYRSADNAIDGELKQIFEVQLDSTITEFCTDATKTTTKIPLCSYMAAKNNYDRTKLYLPPEKPTTAITVFGYVGDETGPYASFVKKLEGFKDKTEIMNAVDDLGGKISKYFETLANFDNEIAKADVGYLQSAIKKNDERLTGNNQKLEELVKEIKKDQKICLALNIFEMVLNIGIAIAGCVAGGAGVPFALGSITEAVKATQTISQTATSISKTMVYINTGIDMLQKLKVPTDQITAEALSQNELGSNIGGVEGAMKDILAKLEANKNAIEGMDKIVQAVQEGVSMNTVQNEVRNFLGAYRNYTPAVTKTDLVELNSKYTGMLDAFEKSFENGGTLCKMFKGGSAAKVREAKDIWASIYSLLEDIRDQQFQLISALVKVVRSKLDQSAAQQIAPRVDYVIYKFEALVRRMLAVRVAAQHVCDTFQYMNNDAPHPSCKSISSTVFLDERIITAMESIEQNLRTEVTTYETRTSTRYALIPVSQNFKNYSIHWEDLIAGGIIEFSLPANNVSFLTANGWINPLFPNEANQMALLKSMEIFIPNILGNTDPIGVEFSIKANQENAVVIAKADAQHYTVRSSEPISTTSKYSINTQCVNEERADFFSDKNSKYCIESNGRFGDTKRLPLPVSMYSKFHIKLEHGYNQATREVLKIYKPVGDTLKLRARLQVYSNPGAAKRRTHITPPDNTYCGEGKYREIVNGRAECKPCPPGSVPVGRGSYCISQEDAKKIAELTGKPLA